MDENRLMYTFTEAAKMLGVSRPTIYKLIKAGKLRKGQATPRPLRRQPHPA